MLYIKKKNRHPYELQFYMHQFVESGIRKGILSKKDYFDKHRLMKRIINRILHKLYLPTIIFPPQKDSVIIATRGGDLYSNSFPYYGYNIIPMLWDCWPSSWDKLYKDINKLKCKQILVTSKFMAEKLKNDLEVDTFWIPEGVDTADFEKGEDLKDRSIELYELGRQHKEYHKVIDHAISCEYINTVKRNEYDKNGKLLKLAFKTSEELNKALSNTKIVVSFPHIDTHPQNAGPIETLTQRYWEAMLSRCLIIGRAPQELIDLIGYDPVVQVDWNNPQLQLKEILNNIDDYQSLVNKNYGMALKKASWDERWRIIEMLC